MTTGITLFCAWLVYWVLSEYALSQPKALFGAIGGCLLFGFYTVQEFRTMMRAADTRFEEEEKWVGQRVSIGLEITQAQKLLGERFTLKQKAKGFSLLAGPTEVYDFSSSLSDLRIMAKANAVVSIEVRAPNEKRA